MSDKSYGPITQVAWVVEDIAATEELLTGLCGAGRWMRMPNVEFGANCEYRGNPADFVTHVSLSYVGDMQLELIEPVSGESVYTEFLARSGPGLHHVCFEPEDFDNAVDDARGRDISIPLHGEIGDGTMRFAYLDCSAAGVPYIELAEISPTMRAFYAEIKANAHRD
ncbi:VOC family protein [Gordonia sp. CPCC 206044]|uniref:VOC family protein n=1 Tax=Gordonia sp. CPCC 206044 TaxID=3140793 RepID=UPI003AF38CBC